MSVYFKVRRVIRILVIVLMNNQILITLGKKILRNFQGEIICPAWDTWFTVNVEVSFKLKDALVHRF